MAGKYFGTDGIRGKANAFPMTAEVAMKVGMAAGLSFQRGNHRHRVVLGKDTRLSGYMIENAMVAGLTAAGMDVFLLGPIPTPAVAMLARSLRADIGVMISASHNPYFDNGIKLFGPDGYKLSDEIEERIEAMLEQGVEMTLADSEGLGRAKRIDGVHDRYIEFAKRTLPKSMSLVGPEGRRRLRQRRGLQGGAGGAVGTWRGSVIPSMSSPTASTSTRNAVRPIRPACRRRCMRCAPTSASRSTATPTASSSSTRRARSSTATRSWRWSPRSWQPVGPARRRRRGGDGHVEPRPGALPVRHRARTSPHQGRRPLCRRAHARAWAECRRRTVRPYRAVGFLDHRRRAGLGAAGARLHQAAGQAGQRSRRRNSSRCRSF